MNNIIIAEDGYNTSYIYSLLIGMFYSQSILYNILLESDPINIYFIYLQECIKNELIEPMRKYKNILIPSSTINKIRNYSFINGWKLDNPNILMNEHNVDEYYDFFIKNISNESIILSDKNNNQNNLLYLNIILNTNKTTIKKELNDYMLNKTLVNVPNIIPIKISRNNDNSEIDINKKIKFSSDLNKRWYIHSILCRNEHNNKKMYYTILLHDDKLLLFNPNLIPTLKEINLDNNIKSKIKKECIFIFYKLQF